MSLLVRYPGRACLLGEHNDWAGGASLTVPLPMGVGIRLEGADRGIRAISEVEGALVEARWGEEDLARMASDPRALHQAGPLRYIAAVAVVLERRGLPVAPAVLSIDSDLPPGRGFSSSAALSLAAADALARGSGANLPPEELAEIAYLAEHDELGIGCGRLDQLACAAARPLAFSWSDGLARTRPLAVGRAGWLVVGALLAPRDTAGILQALRAAHGGALHPAGQATHEALAQWAAGAEAGALALERGDLVGLGEVMNQAQEAYEELLEPNLPALRAPGLRRAVRALRDRGALGAKFSGAGGDGSVIGLFDDQRAAGAASDALGAAGVATFLAELGEGA